MNPPHVLPDHFDIPRRSFNSKLSSSMPVNTMDTTRLRSFSRPVSVEDIRNAKDHIRRRGASAAIGIDLVNQREILAIPDEDLVSLFNHCLDANEIPRIWLTSLLAAIPKKDRDLSMPDSYRAIGLQSCMLKFLTLLIDRRLVEWMEDVDVLPDSQNGFRAHNRTHNNAFILRSAIETAHAQGKVLYVAFVDLENAFPSTDLATLWLKLQELGVGGPMFDWVRHMYRDMDYVVRMGSSCSNTFQSTIGVLAGDTLSPSLWNIYFSDLSIPDHPDDIVWMGRHVSHLEHADDVALFSTSPQGLQHALDNLYGWCAANFMTISVPKTHLWTSIPFPEESVPSIFVGTNMLSYVYEYNFIGMRFDSRDPYIFAKHITAKASRPASLKMPSSLVWTMNVAVYLQERVIGSTMAASILTSFLVVRLPWISLTGPVQSSTQSPTHFSDIFWVSMRTRLSRFFTLKWVRFALNMT